MILAIIQQLKTQGRLADIPEIYRAVEEDVHTNLSFEQICALALFLKDFDLDNATRYTLEGEYHWAYNVYYYLIDQYKKVELVKEVFGIDIEPDIKHDLHYVLEDTGKRNGGKSSTCLLYTS